MGRRAAARWRRRRRRRRRDTALESDRVRAAAADAGLALGFARGFSPAARAFSAQPRARQCVPPSRLSAQPRGAASASSRTCRHLLRDLGVFLAHVARVARERLQPPARDTGAGPGHECRRVAHAPAAGNGGEGRGSEVRGSTREARERARRGGRRQIRSTGGTRTHTLSGGTVADDRAREVVAQLLHALVLVVGRHRARRGGARACAWREKETSKKNRTSFTQACWRSSWLLQRGRSRSRHDAVAKTRRRVCSARGFLTRRSDPSPRTRGPRLRQPPASSRAHPRHHDCLLTGRGRCSTTGSVPGS